VNLLGFGHGAMMTRHSDAARLRLESRAVTVFARSGASLLLFAAAACAAAPRPTQASLRIRSNSPAVVEGRVRDPNGRPVAGIAVRGIPRGADIPWSAWALTGCDGVFRLTLAAPASYGFQLRWNAISVITTSREDPARQDVAVEPGQRRAGVELVFWRTLWRPLTESAPPETPSCP
jgi:hypothetical protein